MERNFVINAYKYDNMKKGSKIAILGLFGIIALVFVNACAATYEKVTFDGVKLTQPEFKY